MKGQSMWVFLFNLFGLLSVSLGFHQTAADMNRFKAPKHLPPPLTSDEAGTWAFDTMSRRIHAEIIPRIIEDNSEELTRPSSPLRAECLLVLKDLQSSLECGSTGFLRPIVDSGPDVATWNELLANIPEEQRNWLEAPWVVAEFYFYRRIVEAFRFFETGYDMFISQKFSGLMDSLPIINEVAKQLADLDPKKDVKQILKVAIFTSLWGNKMDLSLWPSKGTESSSQSSGQEAGKISFGSGLDSIRSYVLDDHSEEVVALLEKCVSDQQSRKEISIIVDNAGYELVSDFILGHCLLQTGAADTITFHTKAHPTFVSDATNEDALASIYMLSSSELEPTAKLGKTLNSYVESGKFRFVNDLFWCQPTAMWDMPETVQQKIQGSRIVFVKGDANYRRLLGERSWPLDTPAKDILSYWSVPVCALRTFKAEIGCGISAQEQRKANQADEQWMVSGKWGVIQLGGKLDK